MKKLSLAKSVASVGLAALCMVGLAACSDASSSTTKYTGGVAATVNGTEIEEDKVTQAIEDIRSQMGVTDEDSWGEWMATYGYTPSSVREEILDSYIDEEIVKQGAENLGISADESEVDSYVDTMKSNYSSDEDWQAALEAVGMTEDEYRESIKTSLVSKALREQVTADLEDPSEEDMLEQAKTYASYYDGAKKSSHILFDSSDEATAKEVLEKIKSGDLDFAEAAKTYSKDTSTAENGGDMGWDKLGSLTTEYTTALADLNANDVSDLITDSNGIHIIKCTEVFAAPEEVTSLDQLPSEFQDTIKQSLISSNQSTAYYAWIDEQREAGDIVINDMPEDVPYNLDMSKYETSDDDTSTDSTTTDSTTTDSSSSESSDSTESSSDASADSTTSTTETSESTESSSADATAESGDSTETTSESTESTTTE